MRVRINLARLYTLTSAFWPRTNSQFTGYFCCPIYRQIVPKNTRTHNLAYFVTAVSTTDVPSLSSVVVVRFGHLFSPAGTTGSAWSAASDSRPESSLTSQNCFPLQKAGPQNFFLSLIFHANIFDIHACGRVREQCALSVVRSTVYGWRRFGVEHSGGICIMVLFVSANRKTYFVST